MEQNDAAARHRDDVALADLIRFLGGMALMASLAFLLLGGYGFLRDRQERLAMGRATATVTEEYVHGGAYYIVYEADGAPHEALMTCEKGRLDIGDQVAIRYDYEWYNDVRQDAPKRLYVRILTWASLGFALGVAAMFGQAYLKARNANPWDDTEDT